MRCGFGFRCTSSPYGRCDGIGEPTTSIPSLASLLFAGVLLWCLLFGVCRLLNDRVCAHKPVVGHPIASEGQIVASPVYQAPYAPHDGAMSGLVAGMVLGTVLSDMHEPPTYVEATDAGYEADIA